jgi:hypothetical protein
MRILLCIWTTLAWAQLSQEANQLLGGAGVAARSRADIIPTNPAHVGSLRFSSVTLNTGAANEEYISRYPGFPANTQSGIGLSPAIPLPQFVYKISPKVGISGFVIPFPVGSDLVGEDIPMVLLGQQNKVDIEGRGTQNGYADLSLGFLMNPQFAIGVGFEYSAVEAKGRVISSVNPDIEVGEFALSRKVFALSLGLKYNLGRIVIGIKTPFVRSTATKQSFDSKLQNNEEQSSGPVSSNSLDFANPIRAGISFRTLPQHEIMMDLVYERVQPNQKRMSLVTLKEKPLDVYDTLSIHAGSIYRINSTLNILNGLSYLPASIGPGGQGPNSKTGFGFFDLIEGMGKGPKRPGWTLGGGLEKRLLPVLGPTGNTSRYRMNLSGGFIYGETSIGIDEKGEQPAAYLVRRMMFPLNISYMF